MKNMILAAVAALSLTAAVAPAASAAVFHNGRTLLLYKHGILSMYVMIYINAVSSLSI